MRAIIPPHPCSAIAVLGRPLALLTASAVLVACSGDEPAVDAGRLGVSTSAISRPSHAHDARVLRARLIASGIPGAGAISVVGRFHPGSVMHDDPAFAALTEPGMVLSPRRVLVASTSNFGAPLARLGDAAGSIISLEPEAEPIDVPPGFAIEGGQASALGGRVRLYAAQAHPFSEPSDTPATAELTSVSMPTGISLNNAGRPWFSNAPSGSAGAGTVTILNASGQPFAIFAGQQTNGAADSPGMPAGALGTAAITKSPDATAKPVFAAVLADGSVVQVHVTRGVDALAPAGTLTPVDGVGREAAESLDVGAVSRQGMVLNWAPTMNLFVADPLANRIVTLDLANDGELFRVTAIHTIEADELAVPVDITPAVREVASVHFSSNTTLGAGSDLFILNRENNSIVRMDLSGNVLGVRAIEADIGPFRASGIAVSNDGRSLYVAGTRPDADGVVLEVPAFGLDAGTARLLADLDVADEDDTAGLGRAIFEHEFAAEAGLGPLFNAPACGACHAAPFLGGMGLEPETSITRVGRVHRDGSFDDLLGRGGPVARSQSLPDDAGACGEPGVPPRANATSRRSAMTLRGNGLIEAVLTKDILANRDLQPSAMKGRANVLPDGRLGKFGWKAAGATLVEFMGEAYRTEMGVTNPLVPTDLGGRGCRDGQSLEAAAPDIGALPLTAVAAFINTLEPPAPSSECLASPGAQLFESVGCATCHTPTLPARAAEIAIYSDLLLHDMGPGLADDVEQGSAGGQEWRTMPLWRVRERSRLLHDGRASTLPEAIGEHAGQAQVARDAFAGLEREEREQLLAFLGCI